MNRAFLLILTVSLFGCPSTQSGDKNDDTGPGGEEGTEGETPGPGEEVSIADIQNGLVADGDLVTVSDVIVTSGLTAEGAGFFVQDAGGGPFSGMYVYTATMTGDLNIHVGDELTISGKVSEYYDFTELSVTSVESIQVTGEGTPTADVVSGGGDWEQWESCLITLEDQTVTSGLDNYGEAELSGGILLDNLFYDYQAEYGATFESVTGLVHYNFEEFKLAPRDAGDLQGYTPGEEIEATVADVQQGVAMGTVTLNNVIVTSELTYDEAGFFVQDEGGGPWSGVYVFVEWADDEALDLQVGDAINLTATVSEYYDLTELAIDAWAEVEVVSSGNNVNSEVLTEAPADWEAYEGVLVTLEDLTLTSDPDSYGESISDWDGLNVDDLLYDYGGSEGTTYESITGVIHYSYEQYKLLPRSADDVGGGGGDPDPDPDPDPAETVLIADIQGGDVSEDSSVTVEGAIVTGVGSSGFFAQDAGGGGWSGIYVYDYGDSGVVVGDVVTFTGTYVEYYDLSEVTIEDAADVSITGSAAPTVTEVTSAPADWEMYESVLIRVQDVEAAGAPDSYGQTLLDNGIYLDDLLYQYDDELEVEAGTSFDSITGPLYYSFEEWKIVPRESSDVAF